MYKKRFINTFRRHGIPIDDMYVERTGNMETGTIDERKKATIMGYLMSGEYTTVALLDDDERNIESFSDMGKCLPQEVYDKVRHHNGLPEDEMITIHFLPILVDGQGSIKRF